MTSNQNGLKANKQRLYNKLSCIEKYIYFSVFKWIPAIFFKLKKCSFAYCPRHYFFLRPSTMWPVVMEMLPTPDFNVFDFPCRRWGLSRVATSPGFTQSLWVWICRLRAQGLIIISPSHPSRHTANFYFILFFIWEVLKLETSVGDVSNYLNSIRSYGNICVEQKFSQSPSVTHMSRWFFSILGNTWPDRRNRMRVELVKSELCT
jgi:hypothetical protein